MLNFLSVKKLQYVKDIEQDKEYISHIPIIRIFRDNEITLSSYIKDVWKFSSLNINIHYVVLRQIFARTWKKTWCLGWLLRMYRYVPWIIFLFPITLGISEKSFNILLIKWQRLPKWIFYLFWVITYTWQRNIIWLTLQINRYKLNVKVMDHFNISWLALRYWKEKKSEIVYSCWPTNLTDVQK